MRPGPLSPERGPTAAEAAAALHKVWLSSVVDVSWQLTTPPEAEATLAIATVPPPSQDDAVIMRAEAIQRTLRRAAFTAGLPFEGEYTSTCGKVWCSRGTAGAQAGAVISLWRPSVPQGYVYFGDFAHLGEKRPPNSALGMLIAPEDAASRLSPIYGKDLFAKAQRFDRVWVRVNWICQTPELVPLLLVMVLLWNLASCERVLHMFCFVCQYLGSSEGCEQEHHLAVAPCPSLRRVCGPRLRGQRDASISAFHSNRGVPLCTSLGRYVVWLCP
jgi:hypothetical protein